MSKLGINTGNSANDGQGDPLRVAMGKINSNFTEIYNTIGDGNNLTSYASTAGISTLARNLTGSPRINVSGVSNTGITTTEHIEVRNITSTGVITATQFVGDGSQLTNVTARAAGLEVLDDNVRKGVARELNFGTNIISSGPDGVGRVTISVPSTVSFIGIATVADYATSTGIATYATRSGVSTNVIGGVASVTSLSVSGITTLGVVTAVTSINFAGGGVLSDPYGDGGFGLKSAVNQYATIASNNLQQFVVVDDLRILIGAAYTGDTNNYKYWNFDQNGNITFPDNTIQSTAFTGYATTSGISTVAQGLTGTPNVLLNQVGIASFFSISGITSFYNDVHFEYDKVVLIGNNNELQLFHNGTNSYIDNSSGGNLIIRAHGGSIQLQKETPELMGVFNTDGSVELYYDSVKKFETTNNGVTITGITTSSGGFVGNLTGTATTSTSSGYATTSGISTVAQGLTGTPNISVGIITATDYRIQSVSEKTTVVNGNTISLVYNAGGGNIAICTNPTGDISLNITGIPTDSTFNNYSLTFSVIVSNTGTARSCTTVTLNGVSTTVKWFGGSLAAAISGVTTTTGYDIYNFTGINTVGSASTTANYIVLGSVNGGYR